MDLLRLDVFSSEFYFNLGFNRSSRKGSYTGLLLSFLSAVTVLSYFIYLLYLYFNNLIDTKYRSQSFITQDRIDVPLQQNLIAFQFQTDVNQTVEQLQAKENKTYLVYYAELLYQSGTDTQLLHLDIVQCQDPELQGFNCIDYSKISNYTLYFNPKTTETSMIILYFYGCLDVDRVKKTIPDNCATQQEINALVDSPLMIQNIKLYTQQYNTTSKQIQTNFRNLQNYIQSDSSQQVLLKVQTQQTKVNQGLVFQSQEQFSSPISFLQNTQSFDKAGSLKLGFGPYNNILLQLDEIILEVEITYPTITEILALVNSVVAICMSLKVLGRLLSQKLIKQDLIMLFLQNLFQDKYEEIVIKNKLIDQKETDSLFKEIQGSSTQQKQQQQQQQQQQSCHIQLGNQTDNYELKQSQDEGGKKQDFVDNCLKDSREPQHYRLNKRQVQSQNLQKGVCGFDKKEDVLNFQDPTEVNQNDEDFIDIFVPSFLTKSRESVEKSQSINSDHPILDIQNPNFQDEVINQSELTKTEGNSPYQNKQKKYIKKISNTSEGLGTLEQMITSPKTNRPFISPKKSSELISLPREEPLQQIVDKKSYLLSLGIEDKSMKKIYGQMHKHLDIYQIYKDLILLKKAMMIILDQEQLAALQLVGCSTEFLEIDDFDESQNIKKMNKPQISEIDKRILSSIVFKDRSS
ncbi:AMP-binding enzyme family protein (macronuclear) [Tetrahymena thermophila SB210]|uniref:AMP-binding enzyme family protein n=1 Tax=Tetrahymena thermophila (strain SB210) TaxID=312017 RepID=Q23F27_TETTS|nr:AMP-binding enzyme family protein [Tetrahymena thermophila SB210]EAR95078.2 AMP-binding enzyme family protein [Tetrahymena thermophila SB210]|eukprot:XP_001015323.2 AMP-binding enzyme family protein [Tetrahymena thermophila SB210]